MLYLFSNSPHNPKKKNYESIILFFKHNRKNYHPIDGNATSNEELLEQIKQENELIIDRFHDNKTIETDKLEANNSFSAHEEIQEDELLQFEEQNKVVKNVLKKEQENDEKVHYQPSELNEKNEVDIESEKTDRKATDKKPSAMKMFTLPKRKKSDHKENVMDNSELDEGTMVEKIEDLKTTKKEKTSQRDYGKHLLVILSVLLFSIGSWFLSKGSSENVNTIAQEQAETEDVLVNALKKFSMKEYEESAKLFDGVEYEALNDDDKDLMLLSYLFSDQPEKAIELEPSFDESVISYYKARHSMQKLRDLAEIVESKAIDFEIAVSDKDYWTIVELKESVKMKGERPQIIINAYLQLENIEGAKKFAKKVNDENLIELVEKEAKELKKKDKKDKK